MIREAFIQLTDGLEAAGQHELADRVTEAMSEVVATRTAQTVNPQARSRAVQTLVNTFSLVQQQLGLPENSQEVATLRPLMNRILSVVGGEHVAPTNYQNQNLQGKSLQQVAQNPEYKQAEAEYLNLFRNLRQKYPNKGGNWYMNAVLDHAARFQSKEFVGLLRQRLQSLVQSLPTQQMTAAAPKLGVTPNPDGLM